MMYLLLLSIWITQHRALTGIGYTAKIAYQEKRDFPKWNSAGYRLSKVLVARFSFLNL